MTRSNMLNDEQFRGFKYFEVIVRKEVLPDPVG